MARTWVAIGAVNGLIAVALGAFGAHILKEHLDAAQLATYEIGVRYQMVHALSLLAVSWLMSVRPSRVTTAAGVCMLAGIILFSGSIYALTLTSWRWVWPCTPAGGASLMLGWLLLAVAPFVGRGSLPSTGSGE